jgi:predicted Zn-dependent protease with MMP-like domain
MTGEISDEQRDRFDALVDEAVESLPPRIRALLDEVPLVVLDHPDKVMLREVGIDPADESALDELCGLHTGISLTEQSIEHSGELPTVVHIFRRGIVALAGGWDEPDSEDVIYEEIRTTILHEIGHHFGLDEEDLADLGYD